MEKNIVLTVSYGDYTIGTGGTDKFILSQQAMLNDNSISTIHIHPIKNISRLHIYPFAWRMLIDGEYHGLYSTEAIIRYLFRLSQKGYVMKCIVLHHLKHVSLNEFHKLLLHIDAPVVVYLHDYMTICPKLGLLKNNSVFCENYFLDEQECGSCSGYYQNMVSDVSAIEDLFVTISNRLTIIAPSEAAKKVWLNRYKMLENNIRVVYHQDLSGKYCDNKVKIGDEQPVNIAFVGYQRPLKGWSQWFDAVKHANQLGCNYKFYQFGTVQDHYDFITEIDIDFKKDLNAMINGLRTHKIDCVVLWSTWPETYSFTYYESYASNCYVITNKFSGNIADQVRDRNNGIVTSGLGDLKQILSDEKGLRLLINNYKQSKQCGPDTLRDNEFIVAFVNDCHKSLIRNISHCLLREIYLLVCKALYFFRMLINRRR